MSEQQYTSVVQGMRLPVRPCPVLQPGRPKPPLLRLCEPAALDGRERSFLGHACPRFSAHSAAPCAHARAGLM